MVDALIPGGAMMRHIAAVVVLSAFAATSIYAAGSRSNVRGVGMARTFVATARGLDAVGINPANLALPDPGLVTISVMPFGLHVGSDFMTLETYNEYFTGVLTDSGRSPRYLTEQDKKNILSGFSGGDGSLTADASARLIGLSLQRDDIGGLAFTITDQLAGTANIPREYLNFILHGNTPGSTYDFSGVEVKASWLREYALSYGAALPKVPFFKWWSGGVGVKLVQGFGYYEIQKFSSSLATSQDGILSGTVNFHSRAAGPDPFKKGLDNFGLFSAPIGRGFALDFGIAGGLTDFLSFGLAVTDIGTMKWSEQTGVNEIDTSIVIDDLAAVQEGSAFDDLLSGRNRHPSPFVTRMPTFLRLGFAFDVNKCPGFEAFPGEMLLALDYNQGINDMGGGSTNPRVSIGAEYKPVHWLPLRGGVSFGGSDHVNIALGFGINVGFFDLDISSENVNWLFTPNSFSHGSIALGTRFRI